MRRLEYILTVFAAILLTTSCSKDAAGWQYGCSRYRADTDLHFYRVA